MQGATARHFDTFAALVCNHQHLLKGSEEPLTDMEVKRILTAGLYSPYITQEVKAAMERNSWTIYTASNAKLINLMSATVNACANQMAAFYSGLPAALRQPPHAQPTAGSQQAPAPRPTPQPTNSQPVKAISAAPAPPSEATVCAWLNSSICLPYGPEGAQARDYLRQQDICFQCRQQGQMSHSCPTFQPQVVPLMPAPTQAPAQAPPTTP
ncbi:hypothetical protein I350_02126 [Cryptococcus amylolentus CBS 6273]|uniref:CCHC-type domain-containing protein n=1 Tax=Cryptococcus amylolentus CBS 6273 TaxID=1296118 RepID=A0A1E3K9N6_9TREE|nr:hypothetical protein I350_02126 [Cryptococcus amylolentus CBS 6273]